MREAALISPEPFERNGPPLSDLFHVLAKSAINLPYVTCIRDGSVEWLVNLAVEAEDAGPAAVLIEQVFRKRPHVQWDVAILSLFPHRKKPAITGALLATFGREGIPLDAMALSPSAISVILEEGALVRAGNSLFGPFAFGTCRTPEDWKETRKGKEKLFREVVATYQEKRPKVYGLEYQDNQELLRISLSPSQMDALAAAFEAFSRQGFDLTFLTATRSRRQPGTLNICLPITNEGSGEETVAQMAPRLQKETCGPVGTFSMNGPHFGDRYGIVGELLTALEIAGVDLMGVSCTISSITGVVPSSHLLPAVEAIQRCFDVPCVSQTIRE